MLLVSSSNRPPRPPHNGCIVAALVHSTPATRKSTGARRATQRNPVFSFSFFQIEPSCFIISVSPAIFTSCFWILSGLVIHRKNRPRRSLPFSRSSCSSVSASGSESQLVRANTAGCTSDFVTLISLSVSINLSRSLTLPSLSIFSSSASHPSLIPFLFFVRQITQHTSMFCPPFF